MGEKKVDRKWQINGHAADSGCSAGRIVPMNFMWVAPGRFSS